MGFNDGEQPSVPAMRPLVGAQVWLFVRVIDNYGDIGVAWRLVRQLRRHFDARISLWVDDMAALRVLVPLLPVRADGMVYDGIAVYPWPEDEAVLAAAIHALPPPQMVVEAFGCDLPAPVLARMAQDRPLWLNWEYLSAEDWAADMHAMPSLQGNGVAKYFWFMGFDGRSGGLLREADYVTRRADFLADQAAQQVFRRHYGLPESPQGQTALLFAYAAPLWAYWLAMWQTAAVPLTLWLAGAQVADSLRAAGVIGVADLRAPGDALQLGCVRLLRIPFVPQAEFDRLLWLADWAVVRGEDSFVRAQWAGLPFLWHSYPQHENAHLPKLQAFWRQASAHWDAEVQQAHRMLSDELNGAAALSPDKRLAAWQSLQRMWPQWRQASALWSRRLAAQPTAMERLASFVQDKLE